MSVALQKLRTLEPSSYTPIASALRKALTMIHQEQIKGYPFRLSLFFPI